MTTKPNYNSDHSLREQQPSVATSGKLSGIQSDGIIMRPAVTRVRDAPESSKMFEKWNSPQEISVKWYQYLLSNWFKRDFAKIHSTILTNKWLVKVNSLRTFSRGCFVVRRNTCRNILSEFSKMLKMFVWRKCYYNGCKRLFPKTEIPPTE